MVFLPSRPYDHRMGQLSAHLALSFRRLRRDAGLTQEDVEERTGISQSEVSRLERGTWGTRLERVEAALVAMGVDPLALLSIDVTEAGLREVAETWPQVDDGTREIVLAILRREVARQAPGREDKATKVS